MGMEGATNPIRVGFIELPDEALDLLSEYTQRADSEVSLVVGQDRESYALRMAEILQVPTLDRINRLALLNCDRLVVGPNPAGLFADVEEVVQGTGIRVVSVEEALDRARKGQADYLLHPTHEMEPNPPEVQEGVAEILENLENTPFDAVDRLEVEDVAAPEKPGARSEGKTWNPELDERDPFERIVELDGDGDEHVHGDAEADPEPIRELHPVPEPDPVRASAGGSFPAEMDAALILGEDLREELGRLMVDSNIDEVLPRILEIAIRATGTQSGSIMLLDPEGTHLRLVAAEGLPAELIARVRQAPGEGIAGEVLKTAKPRVLRGRSRPGPTHLKDVRPKLRESAVVPILSDGRPIGVLSVNLESEHERLNDGTLSLLERFAREVSAAILKAVNLEPLSGERQRDALLRQVERLMALDESMPHRLRAVTEALRKAYRAEIAHIMMLDPLGRRLELMSPRQGLSLNRGEFLPLDRGLYGWVVRGGKPQAITLRDGESGLSIGIMLLPIGDDPVRGLLVLENIPLPTSGPEETLEHLTDIVGRVAEMMEVEKSLEAQELLSQLQIRVADQSSRFSGLLPLEQTRAVLEFGIDLLAAETAVYIPEPGGRAVWARPAGPAVAALQSEIRQGLDPVIDWLREWGKGAGGVTLPGWDPDAPLCAAPYLGVVTGRREGVLLLAFSPQDQAGTLSQVPVEILLRVLSQLGELLPSELNGRNTAKAA